MHRAPMTHPTRQSNNHSCFWHMRDRSHFAFRFAKYSRNTQPRHGLRLIREAVRKLPALRIYMCVHTRVSADTHVRACLCVCLAVSGHWRRLSVMRAPRHMGATSLIRPPPPSPPPTKMRLRSAQAHLLSDLPPLEKGRVIPKLKCVKRIRRMTHTRCSCCTY